MEDLELAELLDLPHKTCEEATSDESAPSEVEGGSPVDVQIPASSLEGLLAERAVVPTTTTAPKKNKPKPKGPAKRPRGGENDLDTAAADSRAAFRHSQRLLRKTATSVDLKTALHRSFSHANESQSQQPRDIHPPSSDTHTNDACASAPQTPTSAALTPKTATAFSVHDITQRFLSKVHEKKQQTIKSLVHQRMVGSNASSTVIGGNHALQPSSTFILDDDAELVIDDTSRSAQQKPSTDHSNGMQMLNQRNHSVVSSRLNPLSSPLFAAVEDSRSSGSQISPTWDTTMSTENEKHTRTDSGDQLIAEDESNLASAIQRKHELLKFKKQQQHALRKDADHGGPSTPGSADGSSSAVPVRQATSLATSSSRAVSYSSTAATPALLQQRNLVNTFHVTTTDISFLKRTNSFENSQSQSIVFRRD